MQYIITFVLILSSTIYVEAQVKDPLYFNNLSEVFLKTALERGNTQIYQNELAKVDLEVLAEQLNNDTKRVSFWVNIYNAYIQVLLQADPTKFENKRSFFSSKQIPLFQEKLSLEKIEHHIIRRSQWKFGLGNFKLWFRPKFEHLLRVDQRESRVHFVLNCGAKSCPPTRVLTPGNLEKQLTQSTTDYLKKTTTFDDETNTVHLTPLFMWFRGDFGNKKGIRKMLAKEGLIPDNSKVKIEKIEYDWTLDLDNWIRS